MTKSNRVESAAEFDEDFIQQTDKHTDVWL